MVLKSAPGSFSLIKSNRNDQYGTVAPNRASSVLMLALASLPAESDEDVIKKLLKIKQLE